MRQHNLYVGSDSLGRYNKNLQEESPTVDHICEVCCVAATGAAATEKWENGRCDVVRLHALTPRRREAGGAR